MSRSLKIHKDCIKQAKLALKHKGFHSQRALAEDSGLALSTVSNFLNGKPVDYATFVEICGKLVLDWQTIADLNNQIESQPITVIPEKANINTYQDWGEALNLLIFCNLLNELTTLEQAIVENSGIINTALTVKLVRHVQGKFESMPWRSLRHTLPTENNVTDLIQLVSRLCYKKFQETEKPLLFLIL